jgi:hypothetical protein
MLMGSEDEESQEELETENIILQHLVALYTSDSLFSITFLFTCNGWLLFTVPVLAKIH